MELDYESIVKFMNDYLRDFSTLGQDPKTRDEIKKYYAPDLETVPMAPGVRPSVSREQFLRRVTEHPGLRETMTPLELIIDDRRKAVVAFMKVELRDEATGEVLSAIHMSGHYHLILDEDKNIRIKKLMAFSERLPDGTPSIRDIMAQRRGKSA